MADYCWRLNKEIAAVPTLENAKNYRIKIKRKFSVIKKQYAILFELSFAFKRFLPSQTLHCRAISLNTLSLTSNNLHWHVHKYMCKSAKFAVEHCKAE